MKHRRYARRRARSRNPGAGDVVLNKQGGVEPENNFQAIRARAVDLVTLPRHICGTNCFNCRWVTKKRGAIGFCKHPLIKMHISKRTCCAAWDAKGTLRPKVKL